MSTEVTPDNDLHPMQAIFAEHIANTTKTMNGLKERGKRGNASRTPEQRARHAERERLRRAKLPETKASELRAKHAERERLRRQSLPPDKLAEERAKHAERERMRRRMVPEEINRAQRVKRAEKQKGKRLNMPEHDLHYADHPDISDDAVQVLGHIIPQEEIFDAVLTCSALDNIHHHHSLSSGHHLPSLNPYSHHLSGLGSQNMQMPPSVSMPNSAMHILM